MSEKERAITQAQWTNIGDSLQWILDMGCESILTFAADGTSDLILQTSEGHARVRVGDWVIKDERSGAFYAHTLPAADGEGEGKKRDKD